MKRTARLASLALVGALALAACGNDDSEDSSATSGNAADESSQTSDKSGSDAEAPAEGEEVDVEALLDDMSEGLGTMSTAHVTMDMTLMGQKMHGEGDSSYEDDDTRSRFTMTVPGAGEMEMVLIGTTLYMKLDQLTQGKFLKADVRDPNGPLGDMSSLVTSVDPAQNFEAYRAGYTKAVYRGEEELQGETMRKYLFTLDLTKVDQFKQQARKAGISETPVEMWLDEDDVMRKLHMEMDVQGQKTVTDVEVSDLGEDVTIEAPPASEVTTKQAG